MAKKQLIAGGFPYTGWLVENATNQVVLTGQSWVVEAASVSPTVNMVGVAGTGAVGALGTSNNPTIHLTGLSGISHVGAFTQTISETLAKVTGTGHVGAVSVLNSPTLDLIGVFGTGQVGTFTETISEALAGVHGTAHVGALAYALTLIGVHGTGHVGSLIASRDVALEGVHGTGHVGALTPTISETLHSVAATGSASPVSADPFTFNLVPEGVFGTGHAGRISERILETLRGVVGTSHVGTLRETIAITLQGVSATGRVGTLVGLAYGQGFLMADFVVVGTTLQTPNVVSLSWSDTRGASWPMNPIDRSLGAEGEYLTTPTWYRLGMARDRIFQLEWATPRATALTGAFIEYEQSK